MLGGANTEEDPSVAISIVDLPIGGEAKILKFENEKVDDIFTPMGLFVGQSVRVIYKSATIVISLNYRMIAMSNALAKRVYVSL
jgi:hypothetical protein